MENVLLVLAVPLLGWIALKLLSAVNDAGGRREVGDERSGPGQRAAFLASALWHRLRGG